MTIAYGFNRADWSYIPGGVSSGTALIRPDFPELKDFPYLWRKMNTCSAEDLRTTCFSCSRPIRF
jgi:hypothetical protein